MTDLHMIWVKDVKPGDYLPYMGDRVLDVEQLDNGNIGLHTENSGVFYMEPYEQFQNAQRDDAECFCSDCSAAGEISGLPRRARPVKYTDVKLPEPGDPDQGRIW